MYSIWYTNDADYEYTHYDTFDDLDAAHAEMIRVQKIDWLRHWIQKYFVRVEIREAATGSVVETIDVHAE